MKITSMVLATSLALVPATVAFADDAKKEALKKAKEAAKEAAKEKAKEKAEKKSEKFVAKKAEEGKAADEAKAAAAAEEKATHAKNQGAIERLAQVATALNDAALQAAVAKLTETENKRHALASE